MNKFDHFLLFLREFLGINVIHSFIKNKIINGRNVNFPTQLDQYLSQFAFF